MLLKAVRYRGCASTHPGLGGASHRERAAGVVFPSVLRRLHVFVQIGFQPQRIKSPNT